jgi:hypothetical protein
MQPLYFTDPGDLSAYVNHAAADAIVAAAASVWNVPTAEITIAQGGTLAEHVSAVNAYLTSNGPVFPSDVQASNYAAIQISVIYDTDGSVTDMLLGGGASSPAECRQNGVTESVDSIAPSGSIQHALLVLNGRCTGPAPEQQLQLQYQLERALGRILGVGWSQTNDNVFTQTPQPTYEQALHWPIMHPIDIVCGQYTYQCLPSPFTLRDDDVSGITQVYLMGYSNWAGWEGGATPPGKIYSYSRAAHAFGGIGFPTGQGMAGVNVVVQRQLMFFNEPEPWYDTSSVSGYLFQQTPGNAVTGTGTGIAASMGSTYGGYECYYDLAWIPMIDDMQGWVDVHVTTEPVNPLYIGTHSVGPYTTGQVAPSGSSMTSFTTGLYPNIDGFEAMNIGLSATDAATNCSTASDGTESSPQSVIAGGWWNGVLCAYGHTAWSSVTMKPGRTATLEVTTLDESGLATTAKAMPLLGVWGAGDPTGTPPTVAATPSAFNTTTLGMTAVSLSTASASGPGAASSDFRFVIADARGDGRPDFAYQARLLYADTVTSATSIYGGQITIQGMGFRAGNEVLVNGVPATVSSWTNSTIVAVAPPVSAFATSPSAPVDVVVKDLETGGITMISGGLTYGTVAPDVMTLVSAPSGTVALGAAIATPFAVRMFLADGITPVVGLPVTFTSTGASLQFAGCAATPCVVLTDSTGLASVTVTPTAYGAVTLQAAAVGAAQTATFNAVAETLTAVRPVEYVAAGTPVAWSPQIIATLNGGPAAGLIVTWTGSAGISFAASSSTANAAGMAQVAATAGPLAAAATATSQACAWGGSAGPQMCASFSSIGIGPADWRLIVVGGAGQAIGLNAVFAPVVVEVTDTAGHPVAGAPVTIHQTVDSAAMPCPATGRCPVAPVLSAAQSSAVSDANGLVTINPLQVPGTEETTNVAVAAGTQGFLSLAIAQGP